MVTKSTILSLFMALFCLIFYAYSAEIGQHPYVFEHRINFKGQEITARVKYLLFLPKSYNENTQQKWPLIMFFHGVEGVGDNIEIIKGKGIPMIVERDPNFPFITLSPQTPSPANAQWVWDEPTFIEVMTALLDQVIADYRVNANRIYLTGLSLGGGTTWNMAIYHPEKYAAIAPLCGGVSFPSKACAIKDVPVWAFHGAKDTAVSIWTTEVMVKALEDCGGNVRFTVYPDLGHDVWTVTYDNPELYDWFLSHSLKKEEIITNVKASGNLLIKWGYIKAR